jgi:hypothetical protein
MKFSISKFGKTLNYEMSDDFLGTEFEDEIHETMDKQFDIELQRENLKTVLNDVKELVEKTDDRFGPYNSAHEGYAVLLEELDELWDIVKTKQQNRDLNKMYREALDVASCAIRFARDLCNEERGRI